MKRPWLHATDGPPAAFQSSWLPDNRWTYWENDRWVDYNPHAVVPQGSAQSTFAGGAQMGSGAGYSGYQPYSGNYTPYYGEGYPSGGGRTDYGPGYGWRR